MWMKKMLRERRVLHLLQTKTMWYSSLSSEISGPFTLGNLAKNLKRTSSEVKMHLYASDPEDCLIFNYEFTAQVEKHLAIGTVHRRRFSYQFKPRALRRMSRTCKGVEERDMTDVDEELRTWRGTRSSYQNNLFWKNPKASKPFYWKQGPIKAQWVEW